MRGANSSEAANSSSPVVQIFYLQHPTGMSLPNAGVELTIVIADIITENSDTGKEYGSLVIHRCLTAQHASRTSILAGR